MIIPNPRVPFLNLSSIRDVVDTDDRSQPSQAYGETEDFPDIVEPCDYSPTGQHIYGGPGDCECRYCRKPSGLDR